MGKFDDKTEAPTPQRRTKAREEGQVARSAEVSVAISLLTLVLVLRTIAPAGLRLLLDGTRALFIGSGKAILDGEMIGGTAIRVFAGIVGPVLAAVVVAAVVSGVGQVGFAITPKALKPKLSKLSPKQGLSKLKPSTALWEVARTGAKVGLLVMTWRSERSPEKVSS